MTNTQRDQLAQTISPLTIAMVAYVIALVMAYFEGGVGMASYVCFMGVCATFIMGHACKGN